MGAGSSASKKDETMADVYQLGVKLGEGSFATVRRGKLLKKNRKTQTDKPIPKFVAIKMIDKKNIPVQDLPSLDREVEILRIIDHPNCVHMYEYFDTDESLNLVLEELKGGELFDMIVAKGHFNENDAVGIMTQIISGTQYLHSKGVVHRDLKPENLLLAESDKEEGFTVKITDFGLAKYVGMVQNELMKTACGTPGYVAPEIIKGQDYTQAVDMWSIGVILFILLCGYPPFYSENQAKLYKKIKNAQYRFASPYWDNVSQDAKDCIAKLLVADPLQRITSEQLLEMPWFKPESTADHQVDLGEHVLQGLRQYESRAKWQKAQRIVIAMNRFSRVSIDRSAVNRISNKDSCVKYLMEDDKQDGAGATSPIEKGNAALQSLSQSSAINQVKEKEIDSQPSGEQGGVVAAETNTEQGKQADATVEAS